MLEGQKFIFCSFGQLFLFADLGSTYKESCIHPLSSLSKEQSATGK